MTKYFIWCPGEGTPPPGLMGFNLNPRLFSHCQARCDLWESETVTSRKEFEESSINHTEGGWPRDVADKDEQIEFARSRFRKKKEKEERFVKELESMLKTVEGRMKQNNSLDIYGHYFENDDDKTGCAVSCMTITSVLKDSSPGVSGRGRCVSDLSWSNGQASRLVVSYCSRLFRDDREDSASSGHVYDCDDPRRPVVVLAPPSDLTSVSYHPRRGRLLAGGCYSGQVGCWDDRLGGGPRAVTPHEVAHTGPVNCVVWTVTNSGNEVMSGSEDGTVRWWDVRNMAVATDCLTVGPGHGVTCLEYDSTIPMRFLAGSERGVVRRYYRRHPVIASQPEAIYKAHYGSVYSANRNRAFPKYFLTVGDWCTKVWSEDVERSNIIWTRWSLSHKYSVHLKPKKHLE